jgi:outer membrane protein OmpA-like peptidoglycan-associated protein
MPRQAFLEIFRMLSPSDDEQQGWILGLVFAIVAAVVALVIIVAVQRSAPTPTPTPTVQVPVVPLPAASAPAGAASSPEPLSSQAASDAASITVEYGVVKFYFASGKAELAAGAAEALVDVVRGAKSGKQVIISGFHDATGNAALNADLARQRAQAVRDALKAAGVADSQIRLQKPEQMEGSGSKAEARRVEIVLQ